MQLYRLAKEEYIRDLSGTGARLYGGRWNRKGMPMLYTSEHRSLALLELLVHSSQRLLPDDISLLTLSLPDQRELPEVTQKRLPKDWQRYPAPNTLADIGSQWLADRQSVGIKVPSVIIPNEWNMLLNPEHSDFSQLTVESVSSFVLDYRFSV